MTFYDQIASNKRKSVLFMGLFLIFVILLGWLFSQVFNSPIILWVAVIVSVVQAMVSYYSGDKIALSISGAREIQKKESPRLWNSVENLCITAGLPMPKVYIIDDPAPNAFATGRDPKHASIAVTSGLLDTMSDSELAGVLAHEISHINNYDIRLMTIIVVLVGVVAILSNFFLRSRMFGFGRRDNDNNGGQIQLILLIIAIVASILAPIAATLIQLSISRKREFLADSSGVSLTRYPDGLASALEKISEYKAPMKNASSATAHMYISNPLGKKQSYLSKIFSTHPPIEERVAALRKLS
ncbi:MAG: zinc metalloprotease HtpX [Patescibacteria group bacterium]|nr:zinc metalloprotease HtpX [Patescibacteria group bacterium]